MENKTKRLLVVCVINAGFTDLVMDAAIEEGASGGTVIHGRGTGNKQIAKTFGITINPNKEIVLIVVDQKIHEKVVAAIYKNAGLDTQGQGIIFTLPLERVAGLKDNLEVEEATDE